MKKVVSLLLAAVCLLAMSAGAEVKLPVTKVKVKNERQFIKALGSNKVITIAKGAKLNLSEVLENEDLCNELGVGWSDCYPRAEENGSIAVSESRNDGRQLTLLNISNLTIVGEKNVEIVVNPRYACVIGLTGCNDIVLKNLTLGHTEEGYCEGPVIGLEHCKDVKIEDCDMYGCGTYGIEASLTQGIECYRSIIRDCSYGIMQLGACEYVTFEECDFYRNREFDLLSLGVQGPVFFRRCRFAQNYGKLIDKDSHIVLENCEIHHPQFGLCDDWRMPNVEKRGENLFFEDLKPLSPRKIGPKK